MLGPGGENPAQPNGTSPRPQAGKGRRTQEREERESGNGSKEKERTANALARRRALGRARYLITARTSPLETESPSYNVQLLDLAGPVGGDLVLHLHRLDHADQVALGDLGALLDCDLKIVPCSGAGSASLEALGPPPDLRSRFGGLARPPAPAGAIPATASPITLTSKSLPETSTL